jgi:hypothetical protein
MSNCSCLWLWCSADLRNHKLGIADLWFKRNCKEYVTGLHGKHCNAHQCYSCSALFDQQHCPSSKHQLWPRLS